MRFHTGQKSILIISGVLAVCVIAFATGVFTQSTNTKTLAERSPCLILNVTPIKNQNGQIIGTFPCVTLTPTPTPSPTPLPQPTELPRPTNPPTNIGRPPPITPGPPPPVVDGGSNSCSHGTIMTGQCTCQIPQGNTITHCHETGTSCPAGTFYTGTATNPATQYTTGCVSSPNDPSNASIAQTPGCQEWCIAKPVIYLYPKYDTNVQVTVTTPGEIVVSDPLYPSGGWKNILAHPNGTFIYNDKNYNELFYETSVTRVMEPINGIVIPREQLAQRLRTVTYQLGLQGVEQDEFINFWIPRLLEKHTPYIFFSILDTAEKERTDHVSITPTPDTMIQFIAYFKPMTSMYTTKPLLLLPKRPERIGFTTVEWGGTIAPEE